MNKELRNVHFIAIGGSVMSNLAVALHKSGMTITGSDDAIYDPAKSNLAANDILPKSTGWDEQNIHKELDAVVLGMHAKSDNPELKKAKSLGIKIYSFPEFICLQSKDKQRIAICGSHGKTSITGMIVHILNYWNKPSDYVIGAQIRGLDDTIKFSDAPIIIIEGDEYLTSALDLTPKFLKYQHNIALISGISWDHVNVYPTLESYVEQFDKLADATPKAGCLVFCEEDSMTSVICNKERLDVRNLPYSTHPHLIQDDKFYLITDNGNIPLKIFGKYNMQNIAGALTLLRRLGITNDQFYEAIQTFEGTYKRSELIAKNNTCAIYEDFAHAPSKLEATTLAMKELHSSRKLTACFELHTYSSLNKNFISHYRNKFDAADVAIIYFNIDNVSNKNLPDISEADIINGFNRQDLLIFNDKDKMEAYLTDKAWKNEDLIFMSSGNFGGLNISELAKNILS